ncbi:MAG TPA: ATP-binding protein [Solirubrobacteraceae bacterium]|nr:ATP-binding protein [Solirubrobacteraceae bacterium]
MSGSGAHPPTPVPSGEPFFELSLDPMVTAGLDGYVKRANEAWERTLGWTEQELRAVPYAEFIHPDDRERTAAEAMALASPGHATRGFEIRLRRRDGVYRRFRFSAVGDPDRALIHAVAKDVTYEGQLEERAKELERSNQELERFAYVASHDLSEPLRMISGFASLLESRYGGQLDADADEFIRYIVDSVGRMQELIRDLLRYSRAGREEPRSDPVDMGVLVTHVLEGLQTAIDESGAAIRVEGLPTVRGDASQLQQLVQNLVANALKFTRDASPVIRISAERDGTAWRFAVADEGIGIAPQDADSVFQVFRRLHGPDDYPGTGVGLAICRTIVERHGGRIWVEPGEERGSVFRFTLPAMQQTAEHGH